MPIGRIGVDIVPLDRVRGLIAGVALRRMLSESEFRLSSTSDGLDPSGIAGRIAAKEAVFKLFHVSGQPMPWLTTEILKGPGGWPEVRLSGRAARLAERAGIRHIAISITHDESCAIAVAASVAPDRALPRGVDMPTPGIDKVRDWILGRHPERTEIGPDENLIESRLVDSLSFVELVYVIEDASGVEMDFDRIDLADFQSVSAIDRAFFTRGEG
ncbi:4'-phosphopantetheinyl transferase superfamily protein [Actinosynnema sp. CS-041913]|uniref:4'-phosphopantetheinyl transferase superfamily protein n=1 Tax=Actinosynnema sp. CS-041913 TaxID=3239917 RepID=UPI003D8C9B1F